MERKLLQIAFAFAGLVLVVERRVARVALRSVLT
jgi:hypothetical protein